MTIRRTRNPLDPAAHPMTAEDCQASTPARKAGVCASSLQ
jgi:hypothetical protein